MEGGEPVRNEKKSLKPSSEPKISWGSDQLRPKRRKGKKYCSFEGKKEKKKYLSKLVASFRQSSTGSFDCYFFCLSRLVLEMSRVIAMQEQLEHDRVKVIFDVRLGL